MAQQESKLSNSICTSSFTLNHVTGSDAEDCLIKMAKMFKKGLITGAIDLSYGVRFRPCSDENDDFCMEATIMTEV